MNYLFDLDGTLADMKHRLHYISNGQAQWDEFDMACSRDRPIWPMVELFSDLFHQALVDGMEGRVRIWTGRKEKARDKTLDWLGKHSGIHRNILAQYLILNMRPKGEHMPSVELKKGWLKSGNWRPDMAFDDQPDNIRMFGKEGILGLMVPGFKGILV